MSLVQYYTRKYDQIYPSHRLTQMWVYTPATLKKGSTHRHARAKPWATLSHDRNHSSSSNCFAVGLFAGSNTKHRASSAHVARTSPSRISSLTCEKLRSRPSSAWGSHRLLSSSAMGVFRFPTRAREERKKERIRVSQVLRPKMLDDSRVGGREGVTGLTEVGEVGAGALGVDARREDELAARQTLEQL